MERKSTPLLREPLPHAIVITTASIAAPLSCVINWHSKGLSISMPVYKATALSNSNIAFIK
jgi:hypothetical protein